MNLKKKKQWQMAAIFVTFLLFVILLYVDHINGHVDYISQLDIENKKIQQNFDNQLKLLVEPLPALTKSITPLKQCTENSIEKLGTFAFTHPQLSTIAVKSKYTPKWCISPEFRSLAQSKPTGNHKQLIGPVINQETQQTYFILQYPGNDEIVYHLYLLKSVLFDVINVNSPLIERVSLTTKDGTVLLENKPENKSELSQGLSLESVESSKLLPDIAIHIDGNEAYIQLGNQQKLWSLRLLSIAIAGLFLLALLLHINRVFSIKGMIKNGVRQCEFYPVFQPVFDATSQQIHGAEILVRWQDSLGEHIMPSQFIEEAEHTGQIVPITIQLIKQAFKQLGDYLIENRAFHLGINLSRAHFEDPNWVQTLQSFCQTFDILPEQILLEVTERTMIDSTEINLSKRMQELHHAGFKLAIDDFGTSHASISYLRHFPLDYLKIDMMYVQAIGTGAVTEALLPPIILIANQLHLKIIAEGVETEAQLNYLKERQVDFIQGWYFAKAMSSKDLLAKLKK